VLPWLPSLRLPLLLSDFAHQVSSVEKRLMDVRVERLCAAAVAAAAAAADGDGDDGRGDGASEASSIGMSVSHLPLMTHVKHHTSHVTRQTSHVTRHTSNITRHTSNITHRVCATGRLCLRQVLDDMGLQRLKKVSGNVCWSSLMSMLWVEQRRGDWHCLG
jgi:hypothetical protein